MLPSPPPEIDWTLLGYAAVAFVCFIIILLLTVPSDAGVHHKDDDDTPPPTFPMF